MKAIMVMFDSLNRHMLPPYGCDWVDAPNFSRLADRSVVFDNAYVGSMPCMPARRELHTGRYNFLHRSWGPLEPFDDSTPEILKENSVFSHLTSDHYHYWEEGGGTYHTRYNNWEFSRGQEGDPWKGDLGSPATPEPNPGRRERWGRQDWVNRSYMQEEADHHQSVTFRSGLDYIEKNHGLDNWFLHIETFDPHEPYFSPDIYKELYDHDFGSSPLDWPEYRQVRDGESEMVRHFRFLNAALISMCDRSLGKVLDLMDKRDMWKDTLLIVNTDHGFLLGEHDFYGKCVMPFYAEIAHMPLFIWDPRSGVQGERRQSLVQTIDLPATLLEFFGLTLPPDMQGVPLRETVTSDRPVRESGLFGIHGGHVNVTDGRYVYMRASARDDNMPLYNYTHMPCHMRRTFSLEEMRTATMAEPFPFTKGCPLMRIDAAVAWRTKIQGDVKRSSHSFGNLLFDLENDPNQEKPIDEPDLERKMVSYLLEGMHRNDAPKEQYERLGLRKEYEDFVKNGSY